MIKQYSDLELKIRNIFEVSYKILWNSCKWRWGELGRSSFLIRTVNNFRNLINWINIKLKYFLKKERKSSHFFGVFQKNPKIVFLWLPMASNGTYIKLDKTNGIVVTLGCWSTRMSINVIINPIALGYQKKKISPRRY